MNRGAQNGPQPSMGILSTSNPDAQSLPGRRTFPSAAIFPLTTTAHQLASSPAGQSTTSDESLFDERTQERSPVVASNEDEVQVGRKNARKVISFRSTDPDNPHNWSKNKKNYVFFAGIVAVVNSTLGSSLPSGAISFIAAHFNVSEQVQLPLPISCFLAGYTVGPTLCGPLSEHYGRKRVLLGFFLVATMFTMACALAPNWPALLFFRFICGVGFSGPITIIGGLYADVFNDPRQRGMAMAWFMVATTGGPIIAPAISGFISENTTWRWVFGFGAMFAAATIPLILALPETYVPVLLSRKAARLRKETGDPDIIAKSDLHKKSPKQVLTVVMTRPWRMLFQEVIVMCISAYCALAYGIFYLYFEAYPIIFQGPDSVYKWSSGIAGLAFLPIGIGAILSSPIFLAWDAYLAKSQKEQKPWVQEEEFRRLPLACIGGPLYVVSMLWIGWSAKPGVHWLAPVASGVPFGMGFLLIFMALLNYLSDAYETYAASAQGIASTCRSIFGVLLPLASHRMFQTLGISWACTLLAFLSLGMCVIPFAFIKFGDQIRANSKFCQALKAEKLRAFAEEELERQQSRAAKAEPSQEDKVFGFDENGRDTKGEEQASDKV